MSQAVFCVLPGRGIHAAHRGARASPTRHLAVRSRDTGPFRVASLEQGSPSLAACSGGEAIALRDAGPPDVVVTDLPMSGIDGLRFARHARGQRPPIPVVLITACAAGEAERKAHSPGGTLYLAKPFASAD